MTSLFVYYEYNYRGILTVGQKPSFTMPGSGSATDHDERTLHDSRHNSSMAVTPIHIEPNSKGLGMTLKPVRVYIGDSNNYKIHHIVQVHTHHPQYL